MGVLGFDLDSANQIFWVFDGLTNLYTHHIKYLYQSFSICFINLGFNLDSAINLIAGLF